MAVGLFSHFVPKMGVKDFERFPQMLRYLRTVNNSSRPVFPLCAKNRDNSFLFIFFSKKRHRNGFGFYNV